MPETPALLDQFEQPIPSGMVRASASAHQAASRTHQDLKNWNPHLGSADSDYLPERGMIAARVHDAARNDAWAVSGLQKNLDNAIGAGLRLSARPDHVALGISREEAQEIGKQIEAAWRGYINDPGFYCDAARQGTGASAMARAYRHRLLDGEAFGLLLWEPKRGGRYATTLQVIDPDRVNNPNNAPDSHLLRAGIEIDNLGAAQAYHIQKTHPGDWLRVGGNSFEWERVPRQTSWGRPITLHAFEADRAGQTRGRPMLTPILKKMRQLHKYDEAELQAALVNAIFAAFIESPFDEDMVGSALQTSGGSYQDQRMAYAESSDIKLDGARISRLFPGEKFEMTASTRPNATYPAFESAALRNIAAGMGISYEQLSQDWSKTNYSSARAALLEVWKFLSARRSFFCDQFMCPWYMAWLEEAIDLGDVVLPAGAPLFYEAYTAWTRCRWTGPGRGWIDPVKEAQAAALRMELKLSTLEDECADQGKDWRDVIEQLALEARVVEEVGLVRSQAEPQVPADDGGDASVESDDGEERDEEEEETTDA